MKHAQLRAIATEFLEGRSSPLETAFALAPYEDSVPGELRPCLTQMVGVASETDDILLGRQRELWHPEARAQQDEKHDRAQAWAEPMVRETCEKLASAL